MIKKLIKKICEAENIDAKKISPQFIISFIDNWKNKGLTHKDVKINKNNTLESQILKVYSIYQQKAQDLNAMDFGDLILFTVKLFEKIMILLKYIEKILNIFWLMNIKILTLFKING